MGLAPRLVEDVADHGCLAFGAELCKDLIDAVKLTPGPAVGRILNLLLASVLDEPALNTKDVLVERAQQLALELGT